MASSTARPLPRHHLPVNRTAAPWGAWWTAAHRSWSCPRDDIQHDLDRRRPGQSRLVTQRDETDTVEIVSGVDAGHTLGSPIAMLVRNKDQRSGAYDHMAELYRPSHAGGPPRRKYGTRAVAGGGALGPRDDRSGRRRSGGPKLLAQQCGIEVLAWVESVHGISATVGADTVTLDDVERDPTRCPDPEAAALITEAIENARRDGDSLGGVVELRGTQRPTGPGRTGVRQARGRPRQGRDVLAGYQRDSRSVPDSVPPP